MFGSAYADMRLVPYLIAVVLLAIRFRGAPDRTTRAARSRSLGLLFFAVRIGGNDCQPGMAADDQQAKLDGARPCADRRARDLA